MKAHVYYITPEMQQKRGQYDMLDRATVGDVRQAEILHDASSFRMVREFDAANQDEVFRAMQGEEWSPNGEARFLIQALGLWHTSMMSGDAVFFPETGHLFLCNNYGWLQIPA